MMTKVAAIQAPAASRRRDQRIVAMSARTTHSAASTSDRAR
jgi:hypothetical protein